MFPLVAIHALFRYKGVLVSLTSLHAEIPFGRGVLGHIAATGRRHVNYGSAGDDDIVTLLGDTALPHICKETCPHLFCWRVGSCPQVYITACFARVLVVAGPEQLTRTQHLCWVMQSPS